MTGWGQDGPLAASAGHDLTYAAVAGALAHIGRAGQLPTPPLNLVADFGGGGMLLALGLVAAMLHAQRTGAGQVVDAAMVDGTALLMAPFFGASATGFWSDERGTNLLDSGAPFYDVYRCSDGLELAVGAIEPQFFAALLEVLELDPTAVPGPGGPRSVARAAGTAHQHHRPAAASGVAGPGRGARRLPGPGADDDAGGQPSPHRGPGHDRGGRTGFRSPLRRPASRSPAPSWADAPRSPASTPTRSSSKPASTRRRWPACASSG